MAVTDGFSLPDDEASNAAVRDYLHSLDRWSFTGMEFGTEVCGVLSYVLALHIPSISLFFFLFHLSLFSCVFSFSSLAVCLPAPHSQICLY